MCPSWPSRTPPVGCIFSVFASSFAFREGCLWKGWCSSLSLSCGSTHTFSSSVVLTRILHRRRRCIAVLIVRSCCRSFLDKCPLSLSVGCSNIWWWRSFWNDDDFIHCSCRVNWHFRCFKICKRNRQGIGILLDSFFGIANGTSVSV